MAKYKLHGADKIILVSIYRFRCLNDDLIYRYCMKEKGSVAYRLRKLRSNDLIVTRSKDLTYHCLTTKGVNVVREILGLSGDGLLTASRIEMHERAVSHQLCLNEFVMQFEKQAEEMGFSNYKYFDELYQKEYDLIRPDGVLELPDHNVFIEIDMGTERRSQLLSKWERYLRFARSVSSTDTKPYQVLFVSLSEKENRIYDIRETVKETFFCDMRRTVFIYVGTSKEMMDTLFRRFVPGEDFSSFKKKVKRRLERKGFLVVDGASISNEMGGEVYDFFIRKVDDHGNLKQEGGRWQQFLVDVHGTGPFSELWKISQVKKKTTAYRKKTGRDVGYIFLVDIYDPFFEKLEQAEFVEVENVFYSTPARLKDPNQELHECLVRFDHIGRIHEFQDAGLSRTRFLRNVIKKEEESKP